MGYLVDCGQTLGFDDSKSILKYIKEHGILQFLNLYKNFKDFSEEDLFWGDEIELHLLNLNKETKSARLQLNNEYIFNDFSSDLFEVQPEYGAWMIETVPKKPYKFNGDPTEILANIMARRQAINSLCQDGDVIFAGTVFPMLKVGDYYVPKIHDNSDDNDEIPQSPEEEKDQAPCHKENVPSSLIPSDLLNPHPRYSALCENIRKRHGEKQRILLPIYPDEKTSNQKTEEEPYPGFIHMDDTVFGAGNTSVQYTFGTKNIDDARYLTDQMNVFSSIVLPLSAASVIFKGKLSDVDVRWAALTQCEDCRTKEESDPKHPNYIPKSRWDTVSRYISNRPQSKEEYNDIPFPLDQEMMKFAGEKAKEMGLELDERMIKHLGFLFLRDPMVIYADRIFVEDSKNNNHFENIQSTNWNNIRFKPPPAMDSKIGWRVELRTVECQLTADEGVAFGMFAYFFANIVIKKEYNFYIPISKVDENVKRGQKRDAVLKEKFWFRKDVQKDSPDEWIEMTIDEILHGKADAFVGLFNLIYDFIKEEYGVDVQSEWEQKKKDNTLRINKVTENMKYFEIISKRAKGELPTIANWSRNFVLKHPQYKKDSVITPEIAFDLIDAMNTISDGQKTYSDFV